MRGIVIIYCLLLSAVLVGLFVGICCQRLYRRARERRDVLLQRQYLGIVVHALLHEDAHAAVPFFPCLNRAGARMVLARTLARLSDSTCSADPQMLSDIVADTGLREYLLRRVRRARGYRRAWLLSLLARLPVDAATAAAVTRYAVDAGRSVRFQVLQVRLFANPAMALRRLADYPDSFSAAELAEIMAMLRRGALPVAYESLIGSVEYNLRSMGVCIIRRFGIEEAERALLHMAAADPVHELGVAAVYALCALHKPLCRREVAHRVALMSLAERRSLLRYMAFEGYAADAFDGVFDIEERPYYESLIHSYKCSLVWS